MCPKGINFFHPPILTPNSISQKDFFLFEELRGWPHGLIDLDFFAPAEETFLNSLLDKERKDAIFACVQDLRPWVRHDVYMAINSETDLTRKISLCDEFLSRIKGLMDCVPPSDLSP